MTLKSVNREMLNFFLEIPRNCKICINSKLLDMQELLLNLNLLGLQNLLKGNFDLFLFDHPTFISDLAKLSDIF
jgi:hypothetical protein